MMGTSMQMGTGTVKPPIRANAHLFQPTPTVSCANDTIVSQQEHSTLTHAEVLTALHRIDVDTAQPSDGSASLDKSGKPLVTHFHVQRLRQMLATEARRLRTAASGNQDVDDDFTESWTPDRPKPKQPLSQTPLADGSSSVPPAAHLPYTSATATLPSAVATEPPSGAIAQALASLRRKKSEKLAQSHALTGDSSESTVASNAATEQQQQRLNQQVVQQFSDDRVIHAQFADWERKDRLSQLLAIQAFGGSAAAAAASKLSQALPRSVAPLATAPCLEAPRPEVMAQTNPVVRLPPKVSTLRKKQKLINQAQQAEAQSNLNQQPLSTTTSTIPAVAETTKLHLTPKAVAADVVSAVEQRAPPPAKKPKKTKEAEAPAEFQIVVPSKPATASRPLKRVRTEPEEPTPRTDDDDERLASKKQKLAESTTPPPTPGPARQKKQKQEEATKAAFVIVPRPLVVAKRRIVRLFS
jgi:hypothetical protein